LTSRRETGTNANKMFLLWCVDVLPKVYIFVQRLVSWTGRGFGSAPQQKHTRCQQWADSVQLLTKRKMFKTIQLLLICSLCFTGELLAQTPETITTATNKFLNTLTKDEFQKIRYEFGDTLRLKWTNLPVGLAPRTGVQYGMLSDSSKIVFHHLLTTILSSQGYLKVTSIMQLDDILNTLYQNAFDKGEINQERLTRIQNLKWSYDNFFISIWGDLKKDSNWGLNFGGHHISINMTVTKNSVSISPFFLGTDPAEVKLGKYSGLRILSKEEDYGFILLNFLTDNQKKKAILSQDVPKDIITNPNSSQRIMDYYGVSVKDMNNDQRAVLELLIQEYTHNFEHNLAHGLYDKIIKTGIEKVYFAWIGSTVRDKPHYYIIHGPDFIIKYDNYPNKGNHIHLILREKGNDFGADILKAHYENSEHHKKN